MPRIRIRDLDGRSLAFDLVELLEVLGDSAAASQWRCEVGEVIPADSARYLPAAYDVAEGGISGALLWQVASNTRQVIDGSFAAFHDGEDTPWVSLHAVDSSWWEIVAPIEDTLLPFRRRFKIVEDVP